MSEDYNEKLAQDYADIKDRTERGMLPLVARIPAIEKAVSAYIEAQDAEFERKRRKAEEEGRSPNTVPIQFRDDVMLGKLAELILYEELSWSHPDKMSIVEYPIMTETQRRERFNQIPSDNVHFDGDDFVGTSSKRHGDEETDDKGSYIYRPESDERLSEFITRLDVLEALGKADLTERQAEAIALVYGEDMTQEQAATEMGVSQQAVNQFLSGALQRLKESWGN